jgi:hypothetical protein
MTAKHMFSSRLAAFAFAAAATLPAAAANLVIVNGNGPGVGFNDPTPAAPVGGNPGLTLGQQRLNAFAYAASIWGGQLKSKVDIYILATMQPLSCNATSAVLGSAGPTFVEADFPNAPVAGHLYHVSLANKLAGVDLEEGFPHIRANFNSRLGEPTCLAGSPFYLGLDGNEGTAIDLAAVLLHEFGHGLGFSTTTSGSSGAQLAGYPSIYDKFAFDTTLGKAWNQMTAAERRASAVNGNRTLVWSGPEVRDAAEDVLVDGTPRLAIKSPAAIAGTYLVGVASFGPALQHQDEDKGYLKIGRVVDQASGTGLACAPLSAANAAAVKGRIALVDRGACIFTMKAKTVQDAGAKAMIVVDNVAASPPADLGGADPTITIPSLRVTLATGNAIKAALGSSTTGVVAKLDVNEEQLAGADMRRRVMLFSPNPYQSGSSVSHWDTSAFRNLLMEPFINADLTHRLKSPKDLSVPFMKDIGW